MFAIGGGGNDVTLICRVGSVGVHEIHLVDRGGYRPQNSVLPVLGLM